MNYKIFIFVFLLLFFILPATAIITYSNEHWDTAASGNVYPAGITNNSSSFLIVDRSLVYVYQYNLDGTHTGVSWDVSGSGINSPYGITMNSTYFWVADYGTSEVYQYNLDGTYTGVSWDTTGSGNGHPYDITMDSEYFWINDPFDDKVYQYYHNGTHTGLSWDISGSGCTNSGGLYVDDTYIWIVDINNDEVYQYYKNGTYYSASWDTSGNSVPFGITMNGTRFYVTDTTDDEVYIYHVNTIPTVPTIISPIDESDNMSSPIMLNVSSTDVDGDAITYYFYGGSSPSSMAFLGNNDSSGGSSYNWSISQYGIYYWTAYANDGHESSSNMTTAEFTTITAPNLIYPTNGSTQYTTYPPLTASVYFSWEDVASPQYRLMIAEDENFNMMAIDKYIGTNNSNQDLVVNKEYWWKVYGYDGVGTYSNSSEVFTFNLTGNSTLTGSAIEGVVYSNGDGFAPIPGAEVIIWNASWSGSAVTGSNGYYLFTGVTSGEIYSLQAKADKYITSSVAILTAGSDPVTNNFYLLDDLTETEWWHHVSFTLMSRNGTRYPGADVNVYIGDSVTPYLTDITGDDGAVVFQLYQHMRYRITFINSTEGISETRILFPIDSKYYVYLEEGDLAFDPGNVSSDFTDHFVNFTNRSWSIQNMTSIEANSSIGLGLLGQGIVAGIVIWIVIGAGGIGTGFVAVCILAMLGVIHGYMILFIAMCAVSLYILGSKVQ